MPKEYLDCVKKKVAQGKPKKVAQKECAIAFFKKYGITVQEAEEQEKQQFAATEDIDLAYLINMPPEKAINYFKAKGYTFSWDWQETWQEAHAKAFTVAKAMRLDILQDIRAIVQKALDEGLTLAQFQKELLPRLKAKGWWGKVAAGDVPGFDPASGVDPEQIVQLGSPYRLKTIYRTNMQTAYMAGRYQSMEENIANRPYWQYVAILDSRTRPAHRELNGQIFRADDPFWDSFYPPNGWGCRCRVRALSPQDIERRGLKVSSSQGKLSTEDRLVSEKTGEVRPVTTYRTPLGNKIAPDPGFSYNPGKAALAPFIPIEIESGINYSTLPLATIKKPLVKVPTKKLSAELLLPSHQQSQLTEQEYMQLFLKEFDADIGKEVIFKDVVGEPIIISEQLFIDRKTNKYKIFKADREIYLKLFADTIKDPAEIWMTWVKKGDQTRICRRYIGIYEDKKTKQSGYVVFDLLSDGWKGTTAFKPKNLQYLDAQRIGSLIYEKK